MSEIIHDRIERVNLARLKAGDTLRITTGIGDAAFRYEFTVETPGRWPVGHIKETNADDEVIASGIFMLQGSGIWTNRHQNPVQDQERAFTSYFDDMYLGSFMVGSHPDNPVDRLVFDKPGQEITEMSLNES